MDHEKITNIALIMFLLNLLQLCKSTVFYYTIFIHEQKFAIGDLTTGVLKTQL